MKTIIKLEELGLFVLGIYFFNQLDYVWWWFLVLILTPDLSMIGYVFGNKTGTLCYNLFHHRGIAIALYFAGIYFSNSLIQLSGVMLFTHSSMDRMFGYGLKYETSFKHTHLGEIGKK
ncbi:DUF4260 domain-containing protein [Flavobacterium sp. AED]|uniref:DUF4260 domain-containing protein n=1 Tax=Flavobacterium sp. AED TaxID=1423323 RepID=UPI00057E04F8|nr:DUF4260 domain-containing protein [Flavobacterium sp. AED]KIA82633.1 hypothetical protein OA85_15365 [Flavobacterium sp. AED]